MSRFTYPLNFVIIASMNENQKQLCLAHLKLVQQWGKHINLTTIYDDAQMWSHHVLDSIAIAPYLKGNTFIDMGTGAGFPGIPLAIMLPEKQFILIDSNNKKIQFLKNVAAQLKLKNVQAIHGRIEEVQLDQPVDALISRAVGNMHTMCQQSQHLLKPNGHYYWMKGKYPIEELKQLPFESKVHKLEIAELKDSQRHLVIIEKN